MASRRAFEVGDFVTLEGNREGYGGIYKIEKVIHHVDNYSYEVFVTHFSGAAHNVLLEKSGPWRSSNFRLTLPPVLPPLGEYE